MKIQHIPKQLVVCFSLLWFGGLNSSATNLAQALNSPFATWTTGGTSNLSWVAQTNVFWRDGNAAMSGAINDDQTSWIETTVVGITNVGFWWKVSSEKDFDLLKFFTNGVEIVSLTISGETVATNSNIALSSGTNILRWAYIKDGTFAEGEDRGWVDEVRLGPPLSLDPPVRLPDGKIQVAVNFGIGWPCRDFYSTNLATGPWTLLATTNTTSTHTLITDAGATNSRSRFYRAIAP